MKRGRVSQLCENEKREENERFKDQKMPSRSSNLPCGRIHIQSNLPALPADPFYAGIKKKPGPKRRPLSVALLKPKNPTLNPHRSYTVNYKLRILSYWSSKCIPCGPTRFREPTRAEVADRFQIPATNLSRWRREEEAGHYQEAKGRQHRVLGGGRQRRWKEMERELFELFRERRAMGRPVRRSWFRRVSKELIEKHYGEGEANLFCFSNGWFRGFLSWHQISLRAITNKASKLPQDFGEAILNWMRFNRRNSQIREATSMEQGDLPAAIGRYRLQNICNMDQTPVPYEFIEGHTYNIKGEKTIWMQSSQTSGWDKRQGTIQLTVFADGVPRVKPLIFFRGKGIEPTIITEMRTYDHRVVVKFNPTAYANSENIVSWLDEQLVPVLEGQPTLLALDLFSGHKTDEVLDTMKANDITVSVIPGGCTGLIQPLDVSINRPFKDILKVS